MNDVSGNTEYVKAAKVSELRENRCKLIVVNDEEVALWRVEGGYYAINNTCPHQHFSVLHQGTLEGTNLTCPMHGWTFSLKSGQAINGDGKARIYRTSVFGDDIFVEKPGDKWSGAV